MVATAAAGATGVNPWLVGGMVGAQALGSVLGGQAASRGQRRSLAEQRRQFNLINEQLSPFREAGLGGLAGVQALLKDPSSVLEDPAYKFALGQGQEAITGRAAAGGTLQSGATLKDLTRFGQGLATSTYQQQIQNQMGLATLGAQSAGQGAQIGAQMSGNIAGGMQNLGAIQAAQTTGVAGAVGTGLKDYYTLSQLGQGGYDPRLDTGAGTIY